MNILGRIFSPQAISETTLGNPLQDSAASSRRLNHFAQMTGGKGFRAFPKHPRTDAKGMTRGDRKRLLRQKADEKAKKQIAASRARFTNWVR